MSTMTQQIFKRKLGFIPEIDSFITLPLDKVLANDITAPLAIDAYEKIDKGEVFDKEKIIFVMDHFTPNKDIDSAIQVKKVRDFSKKNSIKYYFEDKNSGIEHIIIPEKGLLLPGETMIGADSHTCTHGAIGAFATGVGSTDLGYSMAFGETWIKVPSAIGVNLKGRFKKGVTAKDLILYIIGILKVDGAQYKSLEFFGEGAHKLEMSDRFCICNMVVEAGAKNGCFPIDEKTKRFFENMGKKIDFSLNIHPESYEKIIEVDLSQIERVISRPSSPDNVIFEQNLERISIDQVFIGSCTNGRIDDLKVVNRYIKGKKVNKNVRLMIIPGSQKVYLEAIKRGYVENFIEAGAIIGPPSCGPCLGGHLGILADGEVCVSTSNRNFVGRMGHKDSLIYLASPTTAVLAAINGYIGG